jgi:hypothetical protein
MRSELPIHRGEQRLDGISHGFVTRISDNRYSGEQERIFSHGLAFVKESRAPTHDPCFNQSRVKRGYPIHYFPPSSPIVVAELAGRVYQRGSYIKK